MTSNSNQQQPIHIETFNSFPVDQEQTFDILLASQIKPKDLIVTITNSVLGILDRQLEFEQHNNSNNNNITDDHNNKQQVNKCRVSFKAPIVGIYTINVELIHQQHQTQPVAAQFQAKAYDLSKVFITNSSDKCHLNESYEFSVDASDAGEGQLEIAVNEGELPNQVQVLDNGKCIVNFVPEELGPHVVDIKFNGHNVNGCPFVVDVIPSQQGVIDQHLQQHLQNNKQQVPTGNILNQQDIIAASSNNKQPILLKEERILINEQAVFVFDNLFSLNRSGINKEDLLILDPENQIIPYKLTEDLSCGKFRFEFNPKVVGDYIVELKQGSELSKKLPNDIIEVFPFPIKVFDYKKVLVSDVTDGVIGHPIFFFIDASQAGSGNLEIRVSSHTRNVPNYPQSEANAKIRVYFTPTEAVEHSIDIKFNGIPVPGNPFLVKVAQYPQARLPVTSQDLLKYVAIFEPVSFYVDYIGNIVKDTHMNESNCQVHILGPDFVYSEVKTVEFLRDKKKFKIGFEPTKIGPYKLFITVNNELLPSSPILSNVFNINEVKVSFDNTLSGNKQAKPTGQVNKPVTFTVDASRAGEGTLSLAVASLLTKTPVQTDVKVSEKGHGLYNLTFVPIEFAAHSIDMSFNDRVVPNSPFIVEILDANGRAPPASDHQPSNNNVDRAITSSSIADLKQDHQQHQMVQNFENLNLNGKPTQTTTKSLSNSSKHGPTKSQAGSITSRKSLAYGLVNASNIVYLESGVLESNKVDVSLIGPRNEQVPFVIAKGSPKPGESKKPHIEYNPKSIGTHKIMIVESNGKDLREYFVEICDPSLIKVTDINLGGEFTVGKAVTFCLDTRESGQIQLDAINIIGPSKSSSTGNHAINGGKSRDGDHTLLGRIKSISSSSNSSSSQAAGQPLEYTLDRVSEYRQQVRFVPQVAGKHSIEIRCLGQVIGRTGRPFEIDVVSSHHQQAPGQNIKGSGSKSSITNGKGTNSQPPPGVASTSSRENELLQSIVVHGVSLKCTPVNSTGAFIIETNNLAQARDFDVLITDPSNSLVNVSCYLQQDANLLAEWTPKRVGTHKIEVLYKDQQVPGSPFITEAFDPSGVIIETPKSLVYSVGDEIEFKLNRREAGCGELDVAITSPVGQDLPINVEQLDDNELISFTPTVAGKYKMSITFGGYEVPKSPITFVARDISHASLKVSGSGLKSAEVNRSAQFLIESKDEGELKIRIECGDREIVPKVERRQNSYIIKYKPTDIGYASISLYWNGTHIENSPYSVPINDLSKILFLSGTNKSSNTNNQRVIDYEPRIAKEITVDTSKCGPGELKAEAYCRANPNLKFSLPVTQYVSNRYKIVFECPQTNAQSIASGATITDFSTEATYMIRFIYNNVFVPESLASVVVSPMFTQQQIPSTSSVQTTTPAIKPSQISASNGLDTKLVNGKPEKAIPKLANDCPVVALRGHGLVDAKIGEISEFTIDGTEAGPGKPEVRFSSSNSSTNADNINVKLEQLESRVYRASYTAQVVGVYSLNVLWDGKQVAGCPIMVNVLGACDPSKVICTGDGLKGGVLGEEIKCFIDTRRAGPGELTALCTGPQKVAFCELIDRGDGTFILYIKPQEPGRQFLTIKYAGLHIPKSPFLMKVSGKPDPSKVRVHGPGVEHGVLSLYQSRFVCDTRGAGAGQLTVRIRGPKGAFRMETQRESQKDRTILCKYDPTEPGDYRIEIKWSGIHVPGSPFSVMIFDTKEELNRFLAGGMHSNNNNNNPNKLLTNSNNNPLLYHQVPYEPTMVEYGHYSKMAAKQQAAHQKPYTLQ